MNRRTFRLAVVFVFVALALGSACRLYNLEKKLSPGHADFLNKARYIITAKERRAFLDLADTAKDAFIDEFWKKRDPDPSTEENEFRDEYEGRIKRANEIFFSEGIPGWLTDRGRIHILFGPPTDKLTNPASQDPAGRCSETWYYGNFPVIFVDSSCTGHYRLLTYDLSSLREINLMYMHELNLAQNEAQKTVRPPAEEKRLFDLKAGWTTAERTSTRIAGTVRLELDYARIWFKSEGDRLVTTLDVTLEIRDAKKVLIWEMKTSFDVGLLEADLAGKVGTSQVVDFPFAIDDPAKIGRLSEGKDQIILTVSNRTGGETVKKALSWK
jgi:GWxTD domain-containing protein